MPKFTPKSHPQIVGTMAAKIAAETPINDFSDGSVARTLVEAAAQEDFQQYIQMTNIIRNYNLDTTEGDDLDKRAAEYGLTRIAASPHSGFVTIKDSSFTKIATKLYAGLSGPTAGSTQIHVDDASEYPSSGAVYLGRRTTNSEGPLSYSTPPVNNGSYWTITLDVATARDHGTDETVILSQGGTRSIDAGAEVAVPESDVSSQVLFELNQAIQLLDGEDTFENVLVTAVAPGGDTVPANSIISFPNSPFTGATVTNPLPFVNGRNEETDQELRDRIRTHVQSLSRGTPDAIKTGIIGLIDSNTNSSITSANLVPPVSLADGPTLVYINNGRGLEPTLSSIGLESLTASANGGESFFQAKNFPMIKANVISQNVEPFNLSGGETIILHVGTDEESFAFSASDFSTPGKATATEAAQAINSRSVLFEARTISDTSGRKLLIIPKARSNEQIQVDPASTAQTALNFSELLVFTAKLYKNDKLLTKDGITASVISLPQPYNLQASVVTTTDGDITVTGNSRIVTKSVAGANGFTQILSPGDYLKFSTDTDVFYRRVRTIISDTKLILDTVYPSAGGGTGNIVVWNSPQLEVAANGDNEQTEVISFGPSDFANASQALASEVVARIQQELQLSAVELAVNSTRVKLVSDLTDSSNSQMQVRGGGAALALGFCSASTLTGNLTFTGNGRVVTGVGTQFTQDLSEGQWIKAGSDDSSAWTKIETIENDTTLYLKEGYRGSNHTSVSASKINFGELSVGKDKDYTLNRSNGMIELANPLTKGDSLTLGSSNTRAFSDSLVQTYNFSTIGSSSTLIVAVDGGFQGTATAGSSGSNNNFTDSDLTDYHPNLFNGFYIRWLTGLNAGETSFVQSYANGSGQIVTTTSFSNPISAGDKFVLCQVLNFNHGSDFSNAANVFASEVVAAINKQILGAKAQVTTSNKVRILTTNFGTESSLQIIGGSANDVLGFVTTASTSELTNTAYVQTQNTDRQGNSGALGYTLAPGQNLVCIFDGDSLNKTFAVSLQVNGTVSTGGTGNFSASNVGSKYLAASFFDEFWVYWLTGANEGFVQTVTSYNGAAGHFAVKDIFPATLPNPISAGDTFALVPRTAGNVVALLNDYNTTTLSIVGNSDGIGVSGDLVQIATQQPGSTGKVYVTGGTANSIGISIASVPGGSPVNDVTTNSRAGLAKGLFVKLTMDGAVTTAGSSSFHDSSMIMSAVGYLTGMELEFLTGNNIGFKTTVASFDNTNGLIVLTDTPAQPIALTDTYRLSKKVYISDVQGTSAPYTVNFVEADQSAVDVSGFLPARKAAIRDVNGLNFDTTQVEGVDGYKYYTNLVQLAQWTIDGLDSDSSNYPGIGAAGTQFEVLTPLLVKIKLVLSVTPINGVSLNSISDAIKNAVLEYVNSRGVGQEVVLSEIIAAAQSVNGVFDVKITNLTDNITVASGAQAGLDLADLLVG